MEQFQIQQFLRSLRSTSWRALLFRSVGTGARSRPRVLKADTLVILRRKLEQYNSPCISILPCLAWTQPLRSTLAVSWMKFSSLSLYDRPRFVLLLRELVWVLYFYCPWDDSSPNSSALVGTFNTRCHQNHNTAAKELPDVHTSVSTVYTQYAAGCCIVHWSIVRLLVLWEVVFSCYLCMVTEYLKRSYALLVKWRHFHK